MLALSSCIDEYWPEVSKYENLLVIEGGITNDLPPYEIRLSKSAALDSIKYIPLTGCMVAIECSDGQTEFLVESEDGFYTSSPFGMKGENGKKYRIKIITRDNKNYESDFQLLRESVGIDTVTAEISIKNGNGYDHPLQGYQFYVNTEKAVADTNYILWRMESTFHYQSEYYIHWYYNGRLNDFHPLDSLYNCWTTYNVKDIYTFSSFKMGGNNLQKFPLNFVSTEDRKLTIRYSLLVKQFTIGSKAFEFWDALREQNAEQGNLYSRQPYQIRGNVYNVNDAEEPVLGYFTVAGIDTKRIFVDRPDIDFYYSKCSINDGNYKAYSDIYWTDPSSYPVYVILFGGKRAVPGQDCADCRERGGSIVKPDFWEE